MLWGYMEFQHVGKSTHIAHHALASGPHSRCKSSVHRPVRRFAVYSKTAVFYLRERSWVRRLKSCSARYCSRKGPAFRIHFPKLPTRSVLDGHRCECATTSRPSAQALRCPELYSCLLPCSVAAEFTSTLKYPRRRAERATLPSQAVRLRSSSAEHRSFTE